MRKLLILPVALILSSLVSLAAPAAVAEPGGRDLRPVLTTGGPEGKVVLLGCKEPARLGHAWRLFFRLDNTDSSQAAVGTVTVKQGNHVVGRRKTDRVPAGERSSVVSLRAPRSEDVVLETSVRTGSGEAGGGGTLGLKRC